MWNNPTYSIYNWGYNLLTSRGMSHQVIPSKIATHQGAVNCVEAHGSCSSKPQTCRANERPARRKGRSAAPKRNDPEKR